MTKWDAQVSLHQGLQSGQWSEEWRSHLSRGHWRTWIPSELDKDNIIPNVPCAAMGPWKHAILKAVLQQRFPTEGKLVSNYRLPISHSKCPRQWSVVSADLGENSMEPRIMCPLTHHSRAINMPFPNTPPGRTSKRWVKIEGEEPTRKELQGTM